MTNEKKIERFIETMQEKQDNGFPLTAKEQKIAKILNKNMAIGIQVMKKHQAEIERYVQVSAVIMCAVGILYMVYGILISL